MNKRQNLPILVNSKCTGISYSNSIPKKRKNKRKPTIKRRPKSKYGSYYSQYIITYVFKELYEESTSLSWNYTTYDDYHGWFDSRMIRIFV